MQNAFRGLSILALIISSNSLLSQVNSVSPYSRLGLGELNPKVYTRQLGMGSASLGLRDPFNINFSNPASYTALQLSTFQMGFEGSMIRQEQSNPDIAVENGRAGLRYFSFGLPLTDWWGSAISLQPYSFKGYNISSTSNIDTLSVENNFTGSGGLNAFYWGNAFEVAKDLSLGFNLKYIFGRIEETSTVTFDPDLQALVTKSEEITTVSGLSFDFGAQYQYELDNKTELGIGLQFASNREISSGVDRYIYTARDLFNSLDDPPVDSLTGTRQIDGKLSLPSELGIGITIGKNHDQISEHAWGASLDYEQYMGSEYSPAGGEPDFPLVDGYKFQAGGFITPRFAFKKLERNDNYLFNVEYRAGAFYEKTPLQLGGTQIEDYGITFGLGLPIRSRNTGPGEMRISTLNLGLIAGRRGTLENNLIREEYLQLYRGLAISDKWFIKYKYR